MNLHIVFNTHTHTHTQFKIMFSSLVHSTVLSIWEERSPNMINNEKIRDTFGWIKVHSIHSSLLQAKTTKKKKTTKIKLLKFWNLLMKNIFFKFKFQILEKKQKGTHKYRTKQDERQTMLKQWALNRNWTLCRDAVSVFYSPKQLDYYLLD